MSDLVYLNGEWLAPENAKVSVFDRGFLFADGIYEVIPVYQGRPFLAEHHLARLHNSLTAIGIVDQGEHFWRALINELIARNKLSDALLYFQVTRGAEAKRSHLPEGQPSPTIFANHSPLSVHWNTPEPAKVVLCDDIRWLRCDIKSISLLGNIMLKQFAQQHNAIEPILQRNGYITEGASSNYFAVKDGVIYTAPANHLILPGITRMWVLRLAQQLGLTVREEPFPSADLAQLDELFLTSSSREVQPIAQIDDIIIADGRCGPITKQLVEAFHQSKRAHLA
ncbi:D-alanine aminotransferase [Pseudidiomarina piscicola]|uniref:Aminodeoxychorismate lyase n=1 Tax=Pseudidiomarina piscicola TaxID=2614830 RepID=A0A6S6WJM4_9GAMM|nr:aminotransferase class IV [Pseudidiomarina piscicola]CAB0149606.1 D-alanine aminotransferase [Pseudidiomarina piscicola]VZT39054.1 D-alanine aminotransferase [Pseudomonas aeruginosa]